MRREEAIYVKGEDNMMNSFIHSLISDTELQEKIIPKLLELDGLKDFLYKADVTFGSFKDLGTGMDHVVIKSHDNNYIIMVEFADGKFSCIYKMFQSSSKKGQTFEYFLGRVLLEHFSGHCSKLFVHWGKNELEMGGEK